MRSILLAVSCKGAVMLVTAEKLTMKTLARLRIDGCNILYRLPTTRRGRSAGPPT